MSSLSLYKASIPVLTQWMGNLEHILKKGEANASERNIDPAVFLKARLAPDMFDLLGQVEVATSLAKACPFRMTGTDPVKFDDMEQSFASAYARIDKTRETLSGFTREQLDGREGFEFEVQLGPQKRQFTAIQYLSGFILPNVYFHCATAYNILRHNGVPLGKMDFFGGGGQ